jgi:hypothetical protein
MLVITAYQPRISWNGQRSSAPVATADAVSIDCEDWAEATIDELHRANNLTLARVVAFNGLPHRTKLRKAWSGLWALADAEVLASELWAELKGEMS